MMLLNKIIVVFFLLIVFSFKPKDNPEFRKYITSFDVIKEPISVTYNCPIDRVNKIPNRYFDSLLFGNNAFPIFIVSKTTETVSFLVYENNSDRSYGRLSLKTCDFSANLIESNRLDNEEDVGLDWLKTDTTLYLESLICPFTSDFSLLINNVLIREDRKTIIDESYLEDGSPYKCIRNGLCGLDTFNIFPFKKIK
jgi:hypothetical protein